MSRAPAELRYTAAFRGGGALKINLQDGLMSDPTTLVRREQFPLLQPFAAPVTATEKKLAEIWCRALGMNRVGRDDAYDDLGGDSFAAASIFVAIEETFAVTLPMATLLETPTVAQLARRIDEVAARGRTES
jgi:acyl carrier protein